MQNIHVDLEDEIEYDPADDEDSEAGADTRHSSTSELNVSTFCGVSLRA
jgi:hypothetical protein